MRKFHFSFLLVLLFCSIHAIGQAKIVQYELDLESKKINLTGKAVESITVNNSIPGPTLEFTEGDYAVIKVNNNMVYGLTKGQASPTSQKGFTTPVQTYGVTLEPLNPIALALTMKATFVARCFSGDLEETKEIVKKAIKHRGYALVDILQPCVTFNKVNTFKWYKENTYYLDEDYDPTDFEAAFKQSQKTDSLPLGIFYQEEGRATFEDNLGIYENDETPLFIRKVDNSKLSDLIEKKFKVLG